MPRIVPVQLLTCLQVLLDENCGVLSKNEVKRLAGLMTKYSKKLVSKCIYVLILKSTNTDLLDEFMGVGGWSLVYTWLNDGIRAMNWPLVQEILELLLLSPVDVHRLKINSAPKLVKGLCKDGGTEGVRILAKRLVDQWLKIVTAGNNLEIEAAVIKQQQLLQQEQLQDEVDKPSINTVGELNITAMTPKSIETTNPIAQTEERDPLECVVPTPITNATAYGPTAAQKKASEMGLVYKIIVKDGQQVLAKVVPVKPVEIAAIATAPVINEAKEIANYDEIDRSEDYIIEDDEDSNALDLIEEDGDYEETTEKIETKEPLVEKSENSSSSSSIRKEKKSKDETHSKHKSTSSSKKESSSSSTSSKDRKVREKIRDKSKERKTSVSSLKTTSSTTSSSSSSSSSLKKSSSSSSSSSLSSKSKSSSSHKSTSSSSSNDKHRSLSTKTDSRDRDNKDRHRSLPSSSSISKNSSSASYSSSKSKENSKKDKERDNKERLSLPTTTTNKINKETDLLPIQVSPLTKEKEATKQALEKLGRIPKKVRTDTEGNTSIVIPSKKASISIEIRKDSEKASTVKTYKSQFRSHGLNEEAPPPPSRKHLKKPQVPTTGVGMSLSHMKRPSPPPRDVIENKKPKIDINNVTIANEKPGAIKLIAPKKIQTLIETNIFSDALAAATGPKKNIKRKRSSTPIPATKDGQSSPTSPDAPKLAPLKFYQDTLEEKANKDSDNSATENDENEKNKKNLTENKSKDDKDDSCDDEDVPLKKIKEGLEKEGQDQNEVVLLSDTEKDNEEANVTDTEEESDPKKPGAGTGPNGPPGVLVLHRRKRPKKKLSWRSADQLEQIRYFEMDETERVNVTKTNASFTDMKNLERVKERESIKRRGFNNEDNMEEQTTWRPLITIEDVPAHPNGQHSKERKIQTDREMTTLRALYFTPSMIPDSPAEAELEPHYPHDVPAIPLDDITNNPDTVNNYTNMPWPEPKGSPKQGDNSNAGTGGLVGSNELFPNMLGSGGNSPFGTIGGPFGTATIANPITPPQMVMPPIQLNSAANVGMNNWNMPAGPFSPNGPPMMNNQYNSRMPNAPNAGGQNFMGQFGPMNGCPPFGNNGPFGQPVFNGPNFRPMGPNGPMNGPIGNMPMMNNGPPMGNNGPGPRGNNRNNMGNNWTSNGNGPWRPAGTGPNRGTNNNNNGICKAFMRGHCRQGKTCKFIHPMKNNRI